MAVEKSFKNFEMLSEPFEQNNKMYVIVRNPKTQHERTVRWYTDSEYAKLYPEEKSITQGLKNLKNCLGFNKGYIKSTKRQKENRYKETIKRGSFCARICTNTQTI